MNTWKLQDAKNRFCEVVAAAQKEPQTVTKHRKPAAVILGIEEYERLCREARGRTM
jgi:prevent-host-death family protein